MTHVIESDEYREEVAALMGDPIVKELAREATALVADPTEYQSHHFMGAALDEYHRRGGENARTIGGVARAIAAINLQNSANHPLGT
jgi:hypothetical protein